MSLKIAFNGFGRMGRLALRAAWDWPDLEIVHINEIAGSPAEAAHLLQFDSQHGPWPRDIRAEEHALVIEGRRIGWSRNAALAAPTGPAAGPTWWWSAPASSSRSRPSRRCSTRASPAWWCRHR